jgi:hypothetical protein
MKIETKNYDVQSIELFAQFEKAFAYISNPRNLPEWTAAFKRADERSALLVTPNGELSIGLQTVSHKSGTIDWCMSMPDGTEGWAYSRLTRLPGGNTLYTFVLLAPPVPVEQVEGTLQAQRKLLESELQKLQRIVR